MLVREPSNEPFVLSQLLQACESELVALYGRVTPDVPGPMFCEVQCPGDPEVRDSRMIIMGKPAEAALWYEALKFRGYKGWLLVEGALFCKPARDALYHVEDKIALGSMFLLYCHPDSPRVIPECASGLGPHDDEKRGWTVVTAYFDLRSRGPPEHVLGEAHMTMGLEQNLFVVSNRVEELRKHRPAHLLSRTHFVQMELDDAELVVAWLQRLKTNRALRPSSDPANTAEVYIASMLKYDCLKMALGLNPFNSTHFCWCAPNIEAFDAPETALALPFVWEEFRNGLSACFIDYQPKSLTQDLAKYFEWGRCGISTLFFTGSKANMTTFCNAMLAEFKRVALAGFGHLDEQLVSIVFNDQQELFRPYLGDYDQVVSNYTRLRVAPEAPVRNYLSSLAASGQDPHLLMCLCDMWLNDYSILGCPSKDLERIVHRLRQPLATIVSAFVPNVHGLVSPDKYLEWGQNLVDVPVPKIIFMPEQLIARVRGNQFTQLVPFEMEWPPFLESLALPAVRNLEKDNHKYLWLMGHKLQFLQMAIEQNPFGTGQFLWLDFGVMKICDPQTFGANVCRMSTKSYPRVRLAHIWPLQGEVDHDNINWCFAGGSIGGSAAALLAMARHVQAEMYKDIFEKRITWEVNLWYRIYKAHPDLFSPYQADHNDSMLIGY
jgi:hypothetical protein